MEILELGREVIEIKISRGGPAAVAQLVGHRPVHPKAAPRFAPRGRVPRTGLHPHGGGQEAAQ